MPSSEQIKRPTESNASVLKHEKEWMQVHHNRISISVMLVVSLLIQKRTFCLY